MKKGNFHIGTSGWSYPDWKGIYYPNDLKNTDWLSFYKNTFHTTEINASFYHLPKRKTVENWTNKVDDHFLFCPKMSRYLTHIKRLKEPEETLDRFFETFEPMKDKMGLVLIQLPPSLDFDAGLAKNLYKLINYKYSSYAFAVEGRHNTWLTGESIGLMKDHNIAFVISQSGIGFPYAEHITTKDIYIRFHGPGELYASLYSEKELKKFAELMKIWLDNGHTLWIYFNNCYHTYAIQNGLELERMLNNQV